MIKIWKKKRFHVIVLILLVLIPLFTYAQLRQAETLRAQFGTADWRIVAEQRVKDISNRLSSPRVPEDWKQYLRVEAERLKYHLDHDINPEEPNAVTFTREFLAHSIGLFLPLMILVIAADLVSSEHGMGTIKLLVTRPPSRARVLASKYVAMTLYVALCVVVCAALSYLISGLVFGYGGWMAPALVGYKLDGGVLDTDSVYAIPHWLYLLMEMGLVWYSCLIVGVIAVMVSVLIRSTAAGMGVMLAVLISGSILANMSGSWEQAKYLFMLNLHTVVYLQGSLPPIAGMTLPFSVSVLTVWGLASIVVAFLVFTRKDMMN